MTGQVRAYGRGRQSFRGCGPALHMRRLDWQVAEEPYFTPTGLIMQKLDSENTELDARTLRVQGRLIIPRSFGVYQLPAAAQIGRAHV